MDKTYISISTDYIKLNQLLKLTGICMSGAEAKAAISAGHVCLNNVIIYETRKKVCPGDCVAVAGHRSIICISKA